MGAVCYTDGIGGRKTPPKASSRLKGGTYRMYQKYSIGKMASLLGISAEAIRYYESKGIIRPLRDPETGYRYYSTWDLHMLLRARHYQRYGFSLEQVSELFRSRELGFIQARLRDQEAAVEHEIIFQMNMLKRIRQSQAMIQDARESVGVFKLAQRPGIYRINTQQNYTLFRDKAQLGLVAEWAEKEPFVYSCAVFYEDRIRAGDSHFDFGMGLNEEYAEFLQVKQGSGVQYYPPCPCMHTCVPSRSGQYLTLESLRTGFDWLRRNGLDLAGDVATLVVCMTKPEEEYSNWHIVWYPVAPG